ncbi:MAG: flavin reductase family protein [Desulfovibrionaceae bacterium]|nr:flavin reductase family protein [Desulfovibrionaceae bacterium]
MLSSLGSLPFCLPAPVWLVGTYDAEGRPNVMTAVAGGLCSTQPPCLGVSLRRGGWTHASLPGRAAFTVAVPSRSLAARVDFAGLMSGRNADKFAAAGLTPVAGEHVDAPYVAECPVVLELALRHTLELGSHTLYVGEIMDVKVEESCLRPDGLPDPARIDALCFAPLTHEYYATGDFVARAYAVGKTLRRP